MTYICKYKYGKKKREITFKATSRGLALIGLLWAKGVYPKDIISLNTIRKTKTN